MNKNAMTVKILLIISLLLSFQSLTFAEKTGKGPQKTKIEDKTCDYPGGGKGSCNAMQTCLLDGGHPGSMSDGTAMCCPKDPATTPNQTCTMIKTGQPIVLRPTAPTTLGVKAAPVKQPSARDKMKIKKPSSAPASAPR
ncbi:MAG: hypothetical protein ACRBCS_08430 [Cellvibrionaceae bacterium]